MGLTAATLVGTFEDGSTEWHEQRSQVIGSSDIATIMGLSDWKSAYTLYLEKRGELEPAPVPQHVQDRYDYGHHMEPFIAGKFSERNPDLTPERTGSWVSNEHPWLGCNPDYLIGDGVLECKTFPNLAEWNESGPPMKYVVQVQHQMFVLGADHAFIAGWGSMGGYGQWRFDADPFLQSVQLHAAQEFTERVDAGTPPPIDGSQSTYMSLRRLNPSLERGRELTIPEDIPQDVYDALMAAEKAYSDAEKEQLKWRGHMLAHMGTAQFAVLDGKRIASRVGVKDNPPYLKVM